jgi:hypothetical protein
MLPVRLVWRLFWSMREVVFYVSWKNCLMNVVIA